MSNQVNSVKYLLGAKRLLMAGGVSLDPHGIVINAEGLGKTYDGVKWALRNADLSVNRGKVVTLLGPNGAGKTTLVRILTTELEPSTGKLIILGEDALRNPERVRPRIASIPQEAKPIYFVTPYELVFSYLVFRGFSISDAKAEARRALEELGLWDVRNKIMNNLSGGYKRRALVAMALASNAELVFMDEPTTGLDVFSRRSVWDALARLKGNSTVILTTHYIEEAEFLSDEVIIMNNGLVVSRGTVSELLSKVNGEYVVEVYGISKPIFEGYSYVKLNNRYLVYVDTSEDSSLIASECAKIGGKALMRRKTLEDVVIRLIGGWYSDEPTGDLDSS